MASQKPQRPHSPLAPKLPHIPTIPDTILSKLRPDSRPIKPYQKKKRIKLTFCNDLLVLLNNDNKYDTNVIVSKLVLEDIKFLDGPIRGLTVLPGNEIHLRKSRKSRGDTVLSFEPTELYLVLDGYDEMKDIYTFIAKLGNRMINKNLCDSWIMEDFSTRTKNYELYSKQELLGQKWVDVVLSTSKNTKKPVRIEDIGA